MTDVRNYSVIYATKHGLEKTKEKCFRFWERRESCINCIARKAYEKKGQVVKLKFVDRNVYGIIAEYIEINRQPYVLEIVCHTEENVLLSSYGKSQFIDKISNYNKQYYQDVLTKTYDRRYYEEYVRNKNNIITLAIIDANGFKEINDHFGHAAGDEALKNFLRPLKIALEKMIILSVMVETNLYLFSKISNMVILKCYLIEFLIMYKTSLLMMMFSSLFLLVVCIT